jgi:hypothetical protein
MKTEISQVGWIWGGEVGKGKQVCNGVFPHHTLIKPIEWGQEHRSVVQLLLSGFRSPVPKQTNKPKNTP